MLSSMNWSRAVVLLAPLTLIAAFAVPTQLDRTVLQDPTRPEGDVAQDGGRNALAVYDWLGIQPGMTVADLWPGSGYNAHLLSRLMGSEGKVVTVWQFFAREDLFDGQIYLLPAFEERVESAGLDNVESFVDFDEVEAASVDVVLAVRNYHDVEWTFADYKRADTVASIHRITKPGGTVGIIDVATPHEGFHAESHRLNQQVVIDDFTAGGFEYVGSSDLLANPEDDHVGQGFPNRHLTDRYVLKFRKPTS